MSRVFDPEFNRVMKEAEDESDFNRIILADVYPRRQDPFKPRAGITPASAPAPSMLTPEQLQAQSGQVPAPFQLQITQPAQRPVVYQRAAQFALTANTTPIPLQANQYQCDGLIIDVANATTTSLFIGYGSGVTVTSGLEVQPGLPLFLGADNTREQWEIQRLLETIAAMLADMNGYSQLSQYRAPRVVMDASQWYVVATAATPFSVLLFNVPEQQ